MLKWLLIPKPGCYYQNMMHAEGVCQKKKGREFPPVVKKIMFYFTMAYNIVAKLYIVFERVCK